MGARQELEINLGFDLINDNNVKQIQIFKGFRTSTPLGMNQFLEPLMLGSTVCHPGPHHACFNSGVAVVIQAVQLVEAVLLSDE